MFGVIQHPISSSEESWLHFFYRREFNQILEVVEHDSSSCTSSSSEHDLDLLLLEFAFASKRVSQTLTHANDLSDCETILIYYVQQLICQRSNYVQK